MSNLGFQFKNQQLHCEDVPCAQIARDVDTPCYVYSKEHITHQYLQIEQKLTCKKRIFYAVKANSNLTVLKLLKNLGAGFDVVSLGEMQRVLHIGANPQDIVFSGIGKSLAELEFAIKHQIRGIHIESASELGTIIQIAQKLKIPANVAIRVNPNIDAKTHPYISTGLRDNKFGVTILNALELYKQAHQSKFINIVGIACHLGSQIKTIEPYLSAIDVLLNLNGKLKSLGIAVDYMDIGGGMGIAYQDEDLVFDIDQFGKELGKVMEDYPDLTLQVEPGRFIVGNAGILLTKVQYLKDGDQKKFMIIDAAMNDLIRPCLYQSVHTVINTHDSNLPITKVDIVGPICESADFIVKDYPIAAREGDLLAINGCGAYASSMSSNYNSRPRAPEILVDGDTYRLIRRRETVEDLFELEVF